MSLRVVKSGTIVARRCVQARATATPATASNTRFRTTWYAPSGRVDRTPKHPQGGRLPSRSLSTIATVNAAEQHDRSDRGPGLEQRGREEHPDDDLHVRHHDRRRDGATPMSAACLVQSGPATSFSAPAQTSAAARR